MDVNIERQENVLYVQVRGRTDGSNAAALEKALGNATAETDRAVIMDFGELFYISDIGVRAVLVTAKSLQGRDAVLMLCALPDSVGKVFRIYGFDKLVAIHPTNAEAPARLEG